MECSISSSADSWSCQITLRISYDHEGHPLSEPESIPFGPAITDKSSVELWLLRAQVAILSLHRFEDFLEKSPAELQNMMETDRDMPPFSKNIIHIDVSGPGLTDLSFVDLPGEKHYYQLIILPDHIFNQ